MVAGNAGVVFPGSDGSALSGFDGSDVPDCGGLGGSYCSYSSSCEHPAKARHASPDNMMFLSVIPDYLTNALR